MVQVPGVRLVGEPGAQAGFEAVNPLMHREKYAEEGLHLVGSCTPSSTCVSFVCAIAPISSRGAFNGGEKRRMKMGCLQSLETSLSTHASSTASRAAPTE